MTPEELLAHADFLQTLARRLVTDEIQAADIEQQTWLAALEHPPAREKPVRAWLSTVARNFVRRMHRSERRRVKHEHLAPKSKPTTSPDEIAEQEEIRRRLIDAVLQLKDPYRIAIVHRYYDGLQPKEIASRLDISVERVWTHLKRGLAQLRSQLDAQHAGNRMKWLPALAASAGLEAGISTAGAAGGGGTVLAGGVSMGFMAKTGLALLLLVGAGVVALRALPSESEMDRSRALEVALVDRPAATDGAGLEEDPPVQERTTERIPVEPAAARGGIAFSGSMVNLPPPGSAIGPAPASGVTARFTLQEASGFRDISVRESIVVDEHGGFRFECKDPGTRPLTLYITVEKDGEYRAIYRRRRIEDKPWVAQSLALERVPHGTLSGVTVDAYGNPLAGVRVRFDGPTMALGVSLENSPEAFSNRNGRFQVEHFQGHGGIVATLDGYRQLDAPPTRRKDRGGWASVTVVLAPVGSLVLRAEDHHGQSVGGLVVKADISQAEPLRQRDSISGDARQPAKGKSDADGRIVLDEIWTAKKLALELSYKGSTWRSEWRVQDRLIYDPSHEEVMPIVVPTQGILELTIPVPPPFRLHGWVVSNDGSPVADPWVELKERGRQGWTSYCYGKNFRGDEQGCFEHVVYAPHPPERLYVTATDDPSDSSMFGAYSKPRYSGAITWLLDFEAADERQLLIELVLEPLLAIEGKVLTRETTPVKGMISAVPAAGGEDLGLLNNRHTDLREDGGFRLAGLAPGRYDLEVTQEEDFFFTSPLVRHRFHDIEAGTYGLDLTLGETGAATVTIEAYGPDGGAAFLAPVMGLLRFSGPEPQKVTVRAGVTEIRSFDGWPERATLNMSYGQSGVMGKAGPEMYHYYGRVEGSRYTFDAVSPGWYCFAARAFDAQGRAYHPVGTGRIYLEPGSHLIRFALRREGTLKGCVMSGEEIWSLYVALRDESGNPVLTLRNGTLYDRISPVGADGSFILDRAPVGRFTLEFGTEAELHAGECRHAQEIVIVEGRNPPLAVHVP